MTRDSTSATVPDMMRDPALTTAAEARVQTGRILLACVGNIFLGDDAFGVEMAERLQQQNYPANVHIEDFGIRGLDLAYALLDGYDALVLVDAVPRGGAPGTLYLIEATPTGEPDSAGQVGLSAHNMDPVKVLAFARQLGAPPTRTLVVGCEPSPLGEGYEEMQLGLSPPVQAALDEAVRMIDELVAQLSAMQTLAEGA